MEGIISKKLIEGCKFPYAIIDCGGYLDAQKNLDFTG
jgi:hypothetical protein